MNLKASSGTRKLRRQMRFEATCYGINTPDMCYEAGVPNPWATDRYPVAC